MANTIRIKRRPATEGSGAPLSLANAELAYNESSDILYYGSGNNGNGVATSIISIAGSGAYVSLTGSQTITGSKNFTGGTITVPTVAANDNSAKAASTSYVDNAVDGVTSTFPVYGNSGNFTFATGSNLRIRGDGTILTSSASQPSGNDVTVSFSVNDYSITNSKLFHSSVTIGVTPVPLGSSATTLDGLDSITNLGYLALADLSSSYQVALEAQSSVALTASRTLTIDVKNSNRVFSLGGDLSTSGNFSTSGNYPLSFVATGPTSVILPTSGTLVNTGVTSLPSLSAVGTITSGTWSGSVVSPTYGGTGVNNGSKTATLGGNFAVSGTSDLTLTTTGPTNVTLPTSGTLVNSSVTTLSSLSSVGTIGTGTWQGSVVGVLYGGTGSNNGSISGTGALTFTAGGTNQDVTLDPSGTGVVSVSGARVTNLGAPSLPSDAVTKEYADAISQSLNVHASAYYATTVPVSYPFASGGTALTIVSVTGNDTLTFSVDHTLGLGSQIRTGNTVSPTGLASNTTYYVVNVPLANQVKVSTTFGGSPYTGLTNGSGLSVGVLGDPGAGSQLSGTPDTVDGVTTLILGERILVKDHTVSAYNGVYTVSIVGTGSNGVWVRALDMDNSFSGEILQGDFVFVAFGTVNGGIGFVQTAPSPIRMGVQSVAGYANFPGDPITWTEFSSAGQVEVNGGLSKIGNTLAVASASASRITVGSGASGTIDLASVTQTNTTGSAGLSFAQTVNVDSYGRVTGIISAAVQAGSTTQAGVLQVTDSVASTSTTTAASPNSVKTAYDLANAALPKSGGTLTGKLSLVSGSASAASLNFGAGTANPSTPVNGDFWNNSGTLLFYNGSLTKTLAFTDSNITGTSSNVTGIVSVVNGGTGISSLTPKGVLYGNGTSSVQITAAAGTSDLATSNQILTVDGSGNPAWTTTVDGGAF